MDEFVVPPRRLSEKQKANLRKRVIDETFVPGKPSNTEKPKLYNMPSPMTRTQKRQKAGYAMAGWTMRKIFGTERPTSGVYDPDVYNMDGIDELDIINALNKYDYDAYFDENSDLHINYRVSSLVERTHPPSEEFLNRVEDDCYRDNKDELEIIMENFAEKFKSFNIQVYDDKGNLVKPRTFCDDFIRKRKSMKFILEDEPFY